MGNDHIESKVISLKALADDETGKLGEMKPERACFALKPSSLERAGMGVEAPKQPRFSCRDVCATTVGGCRHADARDSGLGGSICLQAIVGVKPDKPTQSSAL